MVNVVAPVDLLGLDSYSSFLPCCVLSNQLFNAVAGHVQCIVITKIPCCSFNFFPTDSDNVVSH